MAFPSPPNFEQLAKQFEEASAHLKLLAVSPDVQQGNLLVKALNDINSRLGNIEKSIKDLQDQAVHVRTRIDGRHQELLREKAT
jgi:chaperonin cofactor prefoldin